MNSYVFSKDPVVMVIVHCVEILCKSPSVSYVISNYVSRSQSLKNLINILAVGIFLHIVLI